MDQYEMMVAAANASISQLQAPWLTYTPTLTWTTAVPIGVTTITRYKIIGKTAFLKIKISATNGNGATGCDITLPIAPKLNNIVPMIPSQCAVGATYTVRSLKIRDDSATIGLSYNFMGTATAGSTFEANAETCYEIN